MTLRSTIWWLAITGIVLIAFAWATRWLARSKPPSTLVQAGFTFPVRAEASEPAHSSSQIELRLPDGPPRIATGVLDALGRPVTVSCASCHSNRPANNSRRSAAGLTEFHQGLTFNHGDLACLSCHNSRNYNLLTLANGDDLDFRDVRALCSQCHMPQARDWERGAHGGMNGYWDTSRGKQIRKLCIDCHDPHVPQFPSMRPTFKPRDRFLTPDEHPHKEIPHE